MILKLKKQIIAILAAAVLDCGGTGEIMVDSIVCRMGIAGNRRQLAMMEAMRTIVEERE